MKILSQQERRQKQLDLEHAYQQKILAANTPSERKTLYKEAYDALYDFSVQFSMDHDNASHLKVSKKMYRRFLSGKEGIDFGCGDGTTTVALSEYASKVTGIDLDLRYLNSAVRQQQKQQPDRISFTQAQEVGEIPFPDASLDFVFSQHVFEHLHPDDGRKHLSEAYRVLRPGGVLIFITPNQFFGPHDVSRYFLSQGSVAQGLHLREYTYKDALPLVQQSGFRRVVTPFFNEHALHMLFLDDLVAPLSFRPGYKRVLEKFFSRHSFGRFGYFVAALLRLRSVVFFCTK